MNEEHFYADVNLPFHVWVRDRSGKRALRWVLREAPQSKPGPQPGRTLSAREPPPNDSGNRR